MNKNNFSITNEGASKEHETDNQQTPTSAVPPLPSDINSVFNNVREEPDNVAAWVAATAGGKTADIKIDAGKKLQHWLRQHPNVRLKLKRLRAPTQYGSTHVCEYVGGSSTVPHNVDHPNKVLTAINGVTEIDGVEFVLSVDSIAPYLTRVKNRVWLKVTATVHNGSVLIIGR